MTAAIKQPGRELAVTGDPRWKCLVARDRSADGQFWYSVATTGIYCRPSCPSRLANPKNVRFHETLESAKATGYRACKRCHPDGSPPNQDSAAVVARACRIIDSSEEGPSLTALASALGLSAGHFHRIFKAVTGFTPKGYAAAQRAARLRQALSGDNSVTDAIYDAGFNSSSRFYEKSDQILGMTPTQYRTGALNEEIHFALGLTTLGTILAASSKKGVVAILLGDDPDALLRNLQDRFPKARLIGASADYEGLVAKVVGLVEAPGIGLNLPLDIRGTLFQRRVWEALQKIPIGTTASYAEIARNIGSPKAVRAVAGACAANSLAIVIPCHRVVRTDGALSGYAWGVTRKRDLLDREVQA